MRGVLKLVRIVSGLRGISDDDEKPWLEVGLCGPACSPDEEGDMPRCGRGMGGDGVSAWLRTLRSNSDGKYFFCSARSMARCADSIFNWRGRKKMRPRM